MGHRDDAAFDEFASSAWPRLRWTAYLLVGDHHLAEDLTQTALARTYAGWSRVRHDDAFGYARKVLVNANIDRLRLRRVQEVSAERRDPALDRAVHGDPVDAVTDRDHVVQLLAGLGAQERRVLVLRFLYDLPEAAIAVELGISRGTVKSTTSRALAKLRARHGEEHDTTTPAPSTARAGRE